MIRRVFLAALVASSAATADTAPAVSISASAQSLQFNYAGLSALPPAQTVQLKASKTGLTYVLSVPPAASWIIPVTPLSGTIPAPLTFRVNPSSLQAGTYNTDVTVTAAGAANSLTIRLTVVVRGAAPVLSASPATVQFDFATNGTAPPVQKLNITTSGQSAAISLSVSGANWLKMSKTAGFTVAGAPLVVDLSVDPLTLATALPKTYDGTLSIIPNDTSVATLKLPIKLVVRAGVPVLSAIWPNQIPQNPGPITLTLTGSNFLKDTRVIVGTNELPPASVMLISSTVLLASLPTAGVLDTQGSYAIAAKNDTQLSATQTFTVNPPGPYLAGIANAASYRATTNVSPGEIISVFGSGLGPTDIAAGTITANAYDKVIADSAVRFCDAASSVCLDAPLIFGSPTQINAVTPFGLAAGATKLRVMKGVSGTPAASNTLDLTVTTANPGIFTADGSGEGQAAAVNVVTDPVTSAQIRSLNSSKNPVPRGGALELYLTGAGTMSDTNTDGEIMASGSTVVSTTVSPTVTINGIACPTVTSFAAPDSIRGLVQVNVVVPSDMTAGIALPLVVTYGSRPSQTVTVAVK